MLALVSALGYRPSTSSVTIQGSPLAGWCACVRGPTSSAPWRCRARRAADRRRSRSQHRQRSAAAGRGSERHLRRARNADAAAQALSALLPDGRGERKHAARTSGAQRLPARLLPHESATGTGDRIRALTAANGAKLPRYYVMDLDKGMAEQVASEMPSPAEIAGDAGGCPDSELRVQRYTGARAFRADSTATAAAGRRRPAALRRPHRRRAVDASSAANATGVSIRTPARSSGSRRA